MTGHLHRLCRNLVMRRLCVVGHALDPMRRTAFAIRHEKPDTAGDISRTSQDEDETHTSSAMFTCRGASHRCVLKRGVKIRGVWARIVNGDASFVHSETEF